MSYERPEAGLNYYPCRYGASRTLFRGPQVGLDAPYVVVLGGSEAYGRYVDDPFCDQVSEMTGRRVVNLGVQNGGVDVFAFDEHLVPIIEGARAVVVQAMGAQNLSNRLYTVHTRRNDRFLRHSKSLEAMFSTVDFSDFSFTRHMMTVLQKASPAKFALVEQELRAAWSSRMEMLLEAIPGQKILLWIEDNNDHGLGPEPLFVTIEMLQRLEPMIDKLVHCDITHDFGDDAMEGMIFPETEEAAARRSMTPQAHARIARNLARALGSFDVYAA